MAGFEQHYRLVEELFERPKYSYIFFNHVWKIGHGNLGMDMGVLCGTPKTINQNSGSNWAVFVVMAFIPQIVTEHRLSVSHCY